MEFEWIAEENTPAEENYQKNKIKKRPNKPILLISLIGVLLLFGGFLFWKAQQGVASVEAEMTTNVETTHQLVLETIERDDLDLFSTLLLDEQLDWVNLQKQLFQQNLLLDRQSFGLTLLLAQENVSQSENITLTFSPDLQQAEVVTNHQYNVASQTEQSEMVTLQQTTHYQRDDNRWVLSPYAATDWGKQRTVETDRLTLFYPNRDREIAASLAVKLDEILGDLCPAITGADCPADFHIQLQLDTDPASLIFAEDIQYAVQNQDALRLPTPSLIGLPVDENGVEALQQGYAIHLAIVGISQLVDYECCRHGLYYRAYLEKQLSELDLRPWPLTSADYGRLLQNELDLFETTRLRSQRSLSLPEEENWQSVFALVDFLVEEFPPELVNQTIHKGYEAYLPSLGYDIDRFLEEWQAFIDSHASRY